MCKQDDSEKIIRSRRQIADAASETGNPRRTIVIVGGDHEDDAAAYAITAHPVSQEEGCSGVNASYVGSGGR